MSIDAIMKKAVLTYCRDAFEHHKPIAREAIETHVSAVARARLGYSPNEGHVWAVVKSLYRTGHLQGMLEQGRLGLSGVRMSLPAKKAAPEQVQISIWEDK